MRVGWAGMLSLGLCLTGCEESSPAPTPQNAPPPGLPTGQPPAGAPGGQAPRGGDPTQAGGLTWTAPSDWTLQGPRPMRVATYEIPAAEGDPEPGNLAVYYFGPGEAGTVEQNIQRWLNQMQTPDGQPLTQADERKELEPNGVKVIWMDAKGTYLFSPTPMSPNTTPKPNYRMLAAIAQGPQGSVYFKLTAPNKTAEAALPQFRKMVESIKRRDG